MALGCESQRSVLVFSQENHNILLKSFTAHSLKLVKFIVKDVWNASMAGICSLASLCKTEELLHYKSIIGLLQLEEYLVK